MIPTIISLVALGLAAASVGLMLDLRDKLDRLLKHPAHQHNRIEGESPKDRRARFLEASRRTS